MQTMRSRKSSLCLPVTTVTVTQTCSSSTNFDRNTLLFVLAFINLVVFVFTTLCLLLANAALCYPFCLSNGWFSDIRYIKYNFSNFKDRVVRMRIANTVSQLDGYKEMLREEEYGIQ